MERAHLPRWLTAVRADQAPPSEIRSLGGQDRPTLSIVKHIQRAIDHLGAQGDRLGAAPT